MASSGERIRSSRLFSDGENAVVVAVDHGLYFGALPGLEDLEHALAKLGSADGILLAAGMVEHVQGFFARRGAPAMILRLNFATNYIAAWKYEHSHSVQLMTAGEAVRLGADVVIASITLRAPDQLEDARNIEVFARCVEEKRQIGVPLIGEVYPIGGDHLAPEELQEQVALGCRMMAELGADMVKTFYTGKDFQRITSSTPIPILALGALKRAHESEALFLAAQAVKAGARGIVFGRNVVQAKDPGRLLGALQEVVKRGAAPDATATKFGLD